MKIASLGLGSPSDGITAPNRATLHDGRIHTDLDVVVLCRSAKDTRIFGKIPLRQGRHHTTSAWTSDAQANLIADGQRVADPAVLDKAPFTGSRQYYNIRSKSSHLKTPLLVKLAELVERRGRYQMDDRTVEERAGRQSKIG